MFYPLCNSKSVSTKRPLPWWTNPFSNCFPSLFSFCHREVYQEFQPSYDIFRRWFQGLGLCTPQPTLPNCWLCINTKPTTGIGRLIKSSQLYGLAATLRQHLNSLPSKKHWRALTRISYPTMKSSMLLTIFSSVLSETHALPWSCLESL